MFACLACVSGDVSADALRALAADFSPRVERVRADVVLVDVGGLGRVIGPPDEIAREMIRTATARGLRLCVAITATRTASTLLALHRATRETAASAATDPEHARMPVGANACDTAGGRPHVPACGRAADPSWVIALEDVAAALAPLPLSLLAALPGDALPDGALPDGALPDRTLRGDRHIAPAGRAPAAPPDPAKRAGRAAPAATYGKTRGARSRGAGRNYRLAPAPGEAHAETVALLDVLHRWGLTTLGEIVRLPPAALFERLGPASFWLRQVALGRDARPLVPTLAADTFDATLELDWPLDTLEPMAFVVSRLLDPLCARLEQRDRGAVAVDVTLRLVTRVRETRRLELPAPMRDPKVLRTLILLDLESHPPGAGIDSVTIRCDVSPGRIVQHSLLTRALPSPEQLSTLIARLTAVMGDGRVGAPALLDSHRPEAFALRPFNPPGGAGPEATRDAASAPPPTRAPARAGSLRRFRRPLPVQVRVTDGRPVFLTAARGVRGGPIVEAAGPWRSSGAWWQPAGGGADARHSEAALPHPASEPGQAPAGAFVRAWHRDEWDIVLRDGEVCRIHFDHLRARWMLESVVD